MIKFRNMLRKRKLKNKYNIVNQLGKEPMNDVISFSNIENIFDSEVTQLIIEHTAEKTVAYKLRIKNVVSALIKRPTLNKKNYEYNIDVPELEKIGEWTDLYYELSNNNSAFNSIYNIFEIINKHNCSKIFIFLSEYLVTNLNSKLRKYYSDLEKHSKQILLRPYFKFIKLNNERELSFTNMSLRCMSWINYGITPSVIINYDNNYIHFAINIDNWENPFTFKINLNINKLIKYLTENNHDTNKTLMWKEEYFYDLNKISDMIPKSLCNVGDTSVIIVNNNFFNLKKLLNFQGIMEINELLKQLYSSLNNYSSLTEYCYTLIAYNLFDKLRGKLGYNIKIIIHEGLHENSSQLSSPAIIGYLLDSMNFDFKKQLC